MFTTQITAQSDMTGFVNIAQDSLQLSRFNEYAKQEERKFLRDLLGDELYIELFTHLDATSGVPTIQKWIDLLDGTTYTNTNLYDVTGAKEAAKMFIFWLWTNQLPHKATHVGTVNDAFENATLLDRQQTNAVINDRWNKGIDYYKELLNFVRFFEEIKEDFTGIAEAPAGTYTVSLSSTKYLEVGDTVSIDGEEFTTTAVTPNTSFAFTATAGKTFTQTFAIWNPFKDVAPKVLKEILFAGLI
jgi:hypothetical protein